MKTVKRLGTDFPRRTLARKGNTRRSVNQLALHGKAPVTKNSVS